MRGNIIGSPRRLAHDAVAEGDLRENPLYRDVFENAPHPYLIVSASGDIVAGNGAARSFFGLETGAWPASFYDLMDGDDLERDITRAAGSSGWQPGAATVSIGSLKGLKQHLNMRGIRLADLDGPHLMLSVQKEPASGFREHTDLIGRLNAQLAEQRSLRADLQEAVEREKYLHHELIHRVKNNLSILATLISVRARSEISEDAREALRAVELRTRSIALVHDLLDRNQTIEVVNSGELIEELCKLMNESLMPENVELTCKVEALKLNNRDATTLCLLISELLTNSLKHAFSSDGGGRIELNFARNGVDKMELRIRDDGRGMPDSAVLQTSHGTQILHALASTLNGELIHNSKAGTEWTLVFHPSDAKLEAAE